MTITRFFIGLEARQVKISAGVDQKEARRSQGYRLADVSTSRRDEQKGCQGLPPLVSFSCQENAIGQKPSRRGSCRFMIANIPPRKMVDRSL